MNHKSRPSPEAPPSMTIDHLKQFVQPGAEYKIISSGTSNRSVSIVSGYKISAPILPANTKENQNNPPHQRIQHSGDSLKRSSRYPIIPGLPIKPKLRRQGHVKKHSNESVQETIAESPVQVTPDREYSHVTPTQVKSLVSPQTPAWARPTQPQRYPSSIFEEYYNGPGSARDSPVHTIEDIVVLKEHDAWGPYWDDKMDGHARHEMKKPTLQRAETLEVAMLLKKRRMKANDYRKESLTSLQEDAEL